MFFKFKLIFSFLITYLNGDVSISDLNELISGFLESAGKNEELKNMDNKLSDYQRDLETLENKRSIYENKMLKLNKNLEDLKENPDQIDSKKKIEEEEIKLKDLKKQSTKLESQISEKNEYITNLNDEKEELIKKCLMKLHSEMKKNHQKVNEDHDRYVDLYTKARAERHVLERKMMNLKSIVYKNYKVRLV